MWIAKTRESLTFWTHLACLGFTPKHMLYWVWIKLHSATNAYNVYVHTYIHASSTSLQNGGSGSKGTEQDENRQTLSLFVLDMFCYWACQRLSSICLLDCLLACCRIVWLVAGQWNFAHDDKSNKRRNSTHTHTT